MENHPKRINRYQIMQLLGEGGMASVYKAYDTNLDRYVAIKLIHSMRLSSDMFLKRFEREAKALAKLSHPHIIQIHDYGEENGIPYLVMEYCPSGTLKTILGKPIPYRQAARQLLPIARALADTHRIGILHRDVKPANILLNESGVAMLSDFGIAKFMQGSDRTDLTDNAIGIGTPEYMAPEQAEGKPIDHRADIYALGVVFYEMVTGHKPFEADTPLSVILLHMTQPLPDPRTFLPDLPVAVVEILKKALEKEPAQRYPTMNAFAEALEFMAFSAPSTRPVISNHKSENPGQPQPDQRKQSSPQPTPPAARNTNLLITISLSIIAGLCLLSLAAGGTYLVLNLAAPTPTATVPTTDLSSPPPEDDLTLLQTCYDSINHPDLDSLAAMKPYLCQTFTEDGSWNLTPQTNPLVTYQTTIGEGRLLFETTAEDRFVLFTPLPIDQSLSDFGISFEAKKTLGGAASSYGVIFRCSGDTIVNENYYYFRISDTTRNYSLHLHQSGGWIDLLPAETSDTINPDAWNQITITAQGGNLEFFINEESVLKLSDTTLVSGTIGLAVESTLAGEKAAFEFDNILLIAP